MRLKSFIPVPAVAALAVWCGYADSACASYADGNDLYKRCAPNTETADSAYCYGYVVAIADVLRSVAPNPYLGNKVCIPLEVKAGQLRDIIYNWLAAHPESRHYSGNSLAASALAQVYPCSDSKSAPPPPRSGGASTNPFGN